MGRNKGNSHSADSISACLNLTQQHFRFNLDGVPAAPVSSSQVSSRRAGQFAPLVHTSSPPPLSRCSLVSSSVSYCLSVSFTSSCCVLSISSAEQIHQVWFWSLVSVLASVARCNRLYVETAEANPLTRLLSATGNYFSLFLKRNVDIYLFFYQLGNYSTPLMNLSKCS